MYGIGRASFKGTEVGYIEKNSFDLGGKKPESAKLEAEQLPGVAVCVIPQSNGSIAPTFNMIQLNYDNLEALLGGNIVTKEVDGKQVTTGWTAPSDAMILEGPWQIDLVSGQSILIPKATLLSNLGGKLTLSESAKIECTLELSVPDDKKVPPYGVFDTDEIPDEWKGGEFFLPKPAAEAQGAQQAAEAPLVE